MSEVGVWGRWIGQIAKMFGVDLDLLVQINKKRYPTLLSSSKLKKDTCIELPPPDMRWILTKQISKMKPEGKKKRVYSVQVVPICCLLGAYSVPFFCPLLLSLSWAHKCGWCAGAARHMAC